jgi:hypothetical protein
MSISEQALSGVTGPDADGTGVEVDRSELTRFVLTHDLLARASRASHGEGQALRFRALHLNLTVIGEVADRMGLTDAERERTEQAALDGLHEAVRSFDPYGEAGFADVATSLVERAIRRHLRTDNPGPPGTSPWTLSRRTVRPARR